MTEFFTPLREHPTIPAVMRVVNVLTLLVKADTLAREQREQMRVLERSGIDCHRSRPFMESVDESNRICKLLNAEFLRYNSFPLVYPRIGILTVTERAATKSKGQWAAWERWAVGTLLAIAKRPGGLSRLRRCLECQLWFYAIKGNKQFCGDSCYRRHRSHDPAFKTARADYMREKYRPNEKRKDARAKQQAGWVSSEKPKKTRGR